MGEVCWVMGCSGAGGGTVGLGGYWDWGGHGGMGGKEGIMAWRCSGIWGNPRHGGGALRYGDTVGQGCAPGHGDTQTPHPVPRPPPQFVPFRDYTDRGGSQVLSMARLAKDVLAEIPEQFISYMKAHGIKPQPAPPSPDPPGPPPPSQP